MTYTVKYRKSNQWFWRTLRKVKGDISGDLTEAKTADLPGMRIFILENEERVEVATAGTEFRFSSERFLIIKKRLERETGQKLPINSSLE